MKAGDSLFEIAPDPTPHELTDVDRQLDSAQASFDRAKVEFERAERALQGRAIHPEVGPRRQREAYELAKIALEKAEQKRDLTRKRPDRDRRASTWSRSSALPPPGRS